MTYRFDRSVGFHATGEHTCRYPRTHGAWLAEVTFRINYDLALSAERPPDDVIAGELKFLPKRFDNASEASSESSSAWRSRMLLPSVKIRFEQNGCVVLNLA